MVKELSVKETSIPGLLIVNLPVHGDSRGWFKENWQREKMVALGLPDFEPVQNNISYNEAKGTTRGIHAEPWDKFISVATGKIFGAWVDLREGDSFGQVFTTELDPSTAIFVPRGVGNAYQTLEEGTAYVYLVNDHWSPEASYTFLNLDDPTSNIDWPIPLEQAERSEKDLAHPDLHAVVPMQGKQTLVLGANGQLGRAFKAILPHAEFLDRSSFDLANLESFESVSWQDYETVINAAAYTRVDEAESPEGRNHCWEANVTGVSHLVANAHKYGFTLVHVSSDYVFDGSGEQERDEVSELGPLGVYGQTKAAGDAIVSTLKRHYIIRTSWVIGDGNNFVKTMASLADAGINPTVVNDQIGRLSFTEDIAKSMMHLLQTQAPYGIYNVTNTGDAQSWAEIAKEIFEFMGHDPARVNGATSEEYFRNKVAAPRPLNSRLSLKKLESTGFMPRTVTEALEEYLRSL